mmetsp:Transcript_9403/g.27617  ORF Transcript_9403/g.27617 Transcript_9403/m.27617 type:complete len:916 (+) Transcript_9403:469-3216(+)
MVVPEEGELVQHGLQVLHAAPLAPLGLLRGDLGVFEHAAARAAALVEPAGEALHHEVGVVRHNAHVLRVEGYGAAVVLLGAVVVLVDALHEQRVVEQRRRPLGRADHGPAEETLVRRLEPAPVGVTQRRRVAHGHGLVPVRMPRRVAAAEQEDAVDAHHERVLVRPAVGVAQQRPRRVDVVVERELQQPEVHDGAQLRRVAREVRLGLVLEAQALDDLPHRGLAELVQLLLLVELLHERGGLVRRVLAVLPRERVHVQALAGVRRLRQPLIERVRQLLEAHERRLLPAQLAVLLVHVVPAAVVAAPALLPELHDGAPRARPRGAHAVHALDLRRRLLVAVVLHLIAQQQLRLALEVAALADGHVEPRAEPRQQPALVLRPQHLRAGAARQLLGLGVVVLVREVRLVQRAAQLRLQVALRLLGEDVHHVGRRRRGAAAAAELPRALLGARRHAAARLARLLHVAHHVEVARRVDLQDVRRVRPRLVEGELHLLIGAGLVAALELRLPLLRLGGAGGGRVRPAQVVHERHGAPEVLAVEAARVGLGHEQDLLRLGDQLAPQDLGLPQALLLLGLEPHGERAEGDGAAHVRAVPEVVGLEGELVRALEDVHAVDVAGDAHALAQHLLAALAHGAAREDDDGPPVHDAAHEPVREVHEVAHVEHVVHAQARHAEAVLEEAADLRLAHVEREGHLRLRHVGLHDHAQVVLRARHVHAADDDLHEDAVELLANPEDHLRLALLALLAQLAPVLLDLGQVLLQDGLLDGQVLLPREVAPVQRLDDHGRVVPHAEDPVHVDALEAPPEAVVVHVAPHAGLNGRRAALLRVEVVERADLAVEGLEAHGGADLARLGAHGHGLGLLPGHFVHLRHHDDVIEDDLHERVVGAVLQLAEADERELVEALDEAVEVDEADGLVRGVRE